MKSFVQPTIIIEWTLYFSEYCSMEFHTKLILVATDFSENALYALKASVDFLQIPQSRLVVVHVEDVKDNDELHIVHLKLDTYIKNFFKHNEPVPVPERVVISSNSFYKAIVDYITKMDPYMLVVGAKGSSNIRNLHIGSNTVHFLEKASCPVLVVPIMNS
ncbi:MAG: universal stress protein [Bacteroidota bacterium]|jgi:nucleotide-binding universal stress UspA family protein